MNKKFFLPLIAVAALGASCTNEVEEFAQQTPNGKGFKVNLQVVKNEANTRIVWDGASNPTWEDFDQFSVFNTKETFGESDGRLTAFANAAYKTVDGGKNFTSENVLYVGKHVLVYPLNTEFYTEKVLTVAPGTDGDKGMGANSIFLSNTPLNITATGVTTDGITYNDAGYQKNIRIKVHPANAGVFFNLKEAGKFQLGEGDDAVQINKVEFIHEGAAKAPFATHAVVAEQSGKIVTLSMENSNTAYTTYTTNKPVLTVDGTVAPIAILPNEAYVSAPTSTSKILVYTNYGVVTVSKAAAVTNKDGKIQIAAGPAEKTTDNETANLSFDSHFKNLAGLAQAGTASGVIRRDVVVDMTTANIDGLEIHNSTDLKNAYRAFDLMGKKKDEVTFKLIPTTDGKFELTKDAIKIINDHKAVDAYAALDISDITEFIISGYGKDAYTTVPAIDQIGAATLVLAADSKWKIDVKDAAAANVFAKVINKGELQLTEDAASDALAAIITNEGTLTFGSNEVTVPVIVAQNGSMEIAEGQSVKMASAEFNDKSNTVVKGELISYPEIYIYSGATVDVYGNLLNTTGNTLKNAGTINIKNKDAQVILRANQNSGIKGTVYVLEKDYNLNTGEAAGYVKLPVASKEFDMSEANMGIANYIEFSGEKLTMNINDENAYVELKTNVKVTAENAKVGLFVVKENVQVTIADGSVIETKKIDNKGKIYNYGTFTYTSGDKGTIYDL